MATADFAQQIEALHQRYQNKLPPVETWNPPLSGDMDMRIAKDGRWFHEGEEIKRQALVDLFATILKREGDDYFLVTPVEKWRIQVDDAPFLVIDAECFAETDREPEHCVFTTSTGDQVVADKEHPIWVEHSAKSGEPHPYLLIRNNMPGLIHRNVYYQLVERALADAGGKKNEVGIYSCGEFFKLD